MGNKIHVDFNLKTLQHYQDSSDDMEKDLADTCQKDFADYGKIVTTFSQQTAEWKEEKSADEYRQLVGGLDHKRREIHNNCLHDIDILNRLAKADGLSAFAVASGSANRTDFGNAIIEQCYENVFKAQPKAANMQQNSYANKRDLINGYNNMLDGYTKYPLIKDKAGGYNFRDMWTQEIVPPSQVENYVKGRTSDPAKLDLLNKAVELTNLNKENKASFVKAPKTQLEQEKEADFNK